MPAAGKLNISGIRDILSDSSAKRRGRRHIELSAQHKSWVKDCWQLREQVHCSKSSAGCYERIRANLKQDAVQLPKHSQTSPCVEADPKQ